MPPRVLAGVSSAAQSFRWGHFGDVSSLHYSRQQLHRSDETGTSEETAEFTV
jgi:hypothetical protein